MSWVINLGRSSFAIAFGILIGAGAAMLGIEAATRDRVLVVESATTAAAAAAAAEPDPVTIVDVSRSGLDRTGGPAGLVAILGIRQGEPVIAVNGVPARGVDDLASAWDRAIPGGYIDVELGNFRWPSGIGRGRRVLVLVHP